MSLPSTIPTFAVTGLPFLKQIDFFEYRNRLPLFLGEDGYDGPVKLDANKKALPQIPRVVGFLDELADVQETLTSSLTNSLWLIGEEGVGKTALQNSLLNKVALGDVAPALLRKKFFIFDQYEFFKQSNQEQASKFDAAMDLMAKMNSLVLIDRFDDFVATCGADRARRLVSSLINALENERVSAIVSSQPGGKQAIEQTSTLFSRHFQPLLVKERGPDQAKNILRQMVPRLEARHQVVIGDDVISEIVRADTYLSGRLKGQSPQRLIDFLDQLSASVNIAKYGKPIELLRQEMQLAEAQAEEAVLRTSVRPSEKKLSAVREKIQELKTSLGPKLDAWGAKFGEIRRVRLELLEAQSLLDPLQKKEELYQAWKDVDALRRQQAKEQDASGISAAPAIPAPPPLNELESKNRNIYMGSQKQLVLNLEALERGQYTETPHVTVNDVQEKFRKMTGVSVGGASNDAERLLAVEEILGRNVFGQDRGKRLLANSYRMREAGTSDPDRPAAVIMLSGGPGCGKTEVIERLAQIDGRPLITFNLSEYTDASSVSKLVGAAPGLVGFGETRTLPSAVKAQSKSIVFFRRDRKGPSEFATRYHANHGQGKNERRIWGACLLQGLHNRHGNECPFTKRFFRK